MTEKPKTWEELEQYAGIKRNVRPSVTQRDVANLTARRLGRWPAWKRAFRRVHR